MASLARIWSVIVPLGDVGFRSNEVRTGMIGLLLTVGNFGVEYENTRSKLKNGLARKELLLLPKKRGAQRRGAVPFQFVKTAHIRGRVLLSRISASRSPVIVLTSIDRICKNYCATVTELMPNSGRVRRRRFRKVLRLRPEEDS